MSLAATIMISGQLTALDSNIFAIIAKLKRQSKRANIYNIQTHIIQTGIFEEITRGKLQERMNSLISDGKVINKSNQNKDSCWINLGLVDIMAESTLNFSHDFYPTPTVAHVDLSPSLISHPEPTPKRFPRFERIEMDNLKNEIILETERNIHMRFQKKSATFKNKCEQLITVS